MIAFIISQFPSYDETFIAREFRALARLGVPFKIYSLKSIKQPVIHNDVRPLIKRTVYMPFFVSGELWRGFFTMCVKRPHKVLFSFLWAFFGHIHKPEILIKSMALFPKSVYFAYLFRKEGVKLIHAHWATYPTTSAVIASRISGIPYSFTAHAHDIYFDQTQLGHKVENAEFILTCTGQNKEFLGQYCNGRAGDRTGGGEGRTTNKVILSYHGFDLDQFHVTRSQGHKVTSLDDKEKVDLRVKPEDDITGAGSRVQNGHDTSKIPNSKSQIPNKSQSPNDKLSSSVIPHPDACPVPRYGAESTPIRHSALDAESRKKMDPRFRGDDKQARGDDKQACGDDKQACGDDKQARGDDTLRNGNGIFRVLSVGSLVPRKGFEYLIDACAILKEKGLHFRCDIIGGGPLEEKLKKQIEDKKLKATVRLHGYKKQNQIITYYRRSDVFALPARLDIHFGIPNVILEAMACRLPVVITGMPAVGEVLMPGQNGLIIREKDPQDLADQIENLYHNSALRMKMGEYGRQRVEELFDINKTARQLAEVFGRYLTNPKH